jgi:hypothetical protein
MLFALIHSQIYGLPSIFLMGFLLAMLAWRSGSLWPSIAAHAAYNACALACAMLISRQRPLGVSVDYSMFGNAMLLKSAFFYFSVALPYIAGLIAVLRAFYKRTPSLLQPAVAQGKLRFSQYWPWIVSFLPLAGFLAINALQFYGIIGSAH